METISPDATLMEQVIKSLPSIVMLTNKKGMVYCVNNLFHKQLGYEHTKQIDLPISCINPYFSAEAWEKHWCKLERKKVHEYKAVFKNEAGKYFHVDVIDQFFSNNGKNVIYSIVNTEHYSMKYDGISSHTEKIMKAGGWKVDYIENTLSVSNELYNIFPNATKADLHPHKVHQFFKKETLFKELYHKVKYEGIPINTILETKDSPSRYLVLMANPEIHNGKAIKVLGAFRDITSDILKNRQLKLFKNIIDNAIDLIYVYNRAGKLVQYSNSVPEKLGFSRKELDNFTIYDLDKQIEKTWWDKHFEEVIRNKALQFEWVVTRKDGTKFPADITANHLVHNGEDYNCAIIRDISEKKRNNLRLSEALEEIKGLKKQLELENEYLQDEMKKSINYNNILSNSESYKSVLKKVALVAPTESTVLITGESGTGKELLATAIHQNSRRNERALIKINCATLPKELIESELFGHKKGAFTGAMADKMGKFKLADHGTIFLDEIGELPIELQAKLLRVLQEGEFEMLGATKTETVDVRIIAATNRDLKAMVEKGTFREDLFYRLNVFPIHNIPLRERKEDIPLLAQFFLERFATKIGKGFKALSKKSLAILMTYDFPGNVRELENMIERAIILENGRVLKPGEWIPSGKKIINRNKWKSFEEMQKNYIVQVLEHTKWRISGNKGAARILNMNDKTLFAKMKKLGIEKKVTLKS